MEHHAVEVHTAQAGEFEARYRALAHDPYLSTFTYGRKKIEELLETELRRFGPGARALDVGCGTGFNVGRLLERGFFVTGIEPSPGMRERAVRDNPRAEILDGDIRRLPFEDDRFEIVICVEVIRYLDDPTVALSELFRVLAPSGLAFVTAAPAWSLNGYALINQLTARVRIPTFTKVRHSFLTARSADQAMREAGFRDVSVHGRFLGPWQAVGRVSPSLLGFILRSLERLDDRWADVAALRDFTNHLVLVGSK